MTKFVTLLFALMRADEQLQSVLVQQPLSNVRAEVAASTSERVGAAAFLGFRVTPQYIHNLANARVDTDAIYDTSTCETELKNLSPVSIPVPVVEVMGEEQRTESPGKAPGGRCRVCWEMRGTFEVRCRREFEESRAKNRKTMRMKMTKWRLRYLASSACISSF